MADVFDTIEQEFASGGAASTARGDVFDLIEREFETTPTAAPAGPRAPVTPPTQEQSWPAFLGEMVKTGALPTIGAVGGLIFGGKPGESIGSAVGEGANQLLGITEPSLAGIVTAAAAPPVTRGALKLGGLAGRGLLRLLAPRVVAEEAAAPISESVTQSLRSKIASLRPPQTNEALYGFLKREAQPIVPLIEASETAGQILRGETVRLPSVKLAKLSTQIAEEGNPAFNALQDVLRTLQESSKHGMSLDEIQKVVVRLNDIAATGEGNASFLLKNIREDLAKAPAHAKPAVAQLLEANRVYRQQKATDKLVDLTIRATGYSPTTGVRSIRPGAIRNVLERDDFLRESFPPIVLRQIDDTVTYALRQMDKIPTSDIGPIGHIGRFAIPATAGGLIGTTIGAPAAGAIGGLLLVPPLVARAASTAPGRALVRRLFATPQKLSASTVVTELTNFLAAQSRTQEEQPNG